jgi:hypothetical protein
MPDPVEADRGAPVLEEIGAVGAAGEPRREMGCLSRGAGVALSTRRFLRLLPPAIASAATMGTAGEQSRIAVLAASRGGSTGGS